MPYLSNANNPFRGLPRSVAMPERWVAVTPHATNYLEGNSSLFNVAVCLYTSGGGDITYIDAYGTSTTVTLAAGAFWPCSAVRVLSAGTDATNIMAGFIGELPS